VIDEDPAATPTYSHLDEIFAESRRRTARRISIPYYVEARIIRVKTAGGIACVFLRRRASFAAISSGSMNVPAPDVGLTGTNVARAGGRGEGARRRGGEEERRLARLQMDFAPIYSVFKVRLGDDTGPFNCSLTVLDFHARLSIYSADLYLRARTKTLMPASAWLSQVLGAQIKSFKATRL
jgi:hypothetical protein